ncbi:MAG: NADH-quinone oxidoreductase subunit J [Rectinemataceae bacterium]
MLGVIFFYFFAALAVVAAVAMVVTRNLVHAALFMAGTFLLIAFLFILMGADYVGAVQILVYVGAISILFVFGIMLTKRDRIEDSNRFNRYGVAATIVAVLLFGGIVLAVLGAAFRTVPAADSSSTIQTIANLFLNEYVLAFEFAGILLLAALVGAIVIGQTHLGKARAKPRAAGAGIEGGKA